MPPFAPITLLQPDIIRGVVGMWFGAIVNIPEGWALCDGTQGTPDLRDEFIISSGGSFLPNDIGGASSHTEFTPGTGHAHSRAVGEGLGAGNDFRRGVQATNVDGISDPSSNLPPFYALAYIMFLG